MHAPKHGDGPSARPETSQEEGGPRWQESPDPGFPVTVNVFVTDIAESTAWYRAVLDDARMMRPEPTVVAFEIVEGVWLELIEAEWAIAQGMSGDISPGGATVRFGVKDVRRKKSRLESSGVATGAIVGPGSGQVTMFDVRDPSGNLLSFYELRVEGE